MVLFDSDPGCRLGRASGPRRETSDHFDGKRFFNPTLAKRFSPGMADVFGMIREGRARWPGAVENVDVPRLDEDLGAAGVAITFVNHATFLIQLPGMNILTDPLWSTRASPVSWLGPKRVRPPGVRLDELPRIDVVLISHNHYDHLDVATLKMLDQRFLPKVVVPLGDQALMKSIGIHRGQELDWWDRVEFGDDVRITFTPTQHSSARGLFDRDRSLWGSYFIERRGRRVYFGGDAGYSTHFAETRRRLGAPDVALLGIGAYAPRWFLKPVHMDPAEAVVAHRDLGAAVSIGMHFGTFQLSSEAFDQPRLLLDDALAREGLSPECFTTLREGETRVFGMTTGRATSLRSRSDRETC